MGGLLKSARQQVKEGGGCATEGSLLHINTQMRYYRVADDPDSLSDQEWALRYAILEDIRQKEKQTAQQQPNLPYYVKR